MQIQQAPHYFVYIFGNQPNAEIKIGIANDIHQQIQQQSEAETTTSPKSDKYKLVYYEHYDLEEIAKHRESQIKSGSMDMTYNLISSMNPNWLDLSDMIQT